MDSSKPKIIMKPKIFLPRIVLALGRVMPGIIFLLLTRQAEANPTGLTVQSGSASTSVSGSKLTVTAGNNAFLNWQSFNIAAGETTIFSQPSANSVVWNQIGGQSASQIYGSLQANGVVVLLNSSGFYFGPNSYVSAAGLVVSTANCLPPQNAGGAWEFNGPPPLASIVNYGQIQIGQNGSCFLIANVVENHGSIDAPGGELGLAAGQTVELSERPDGRGMSMKVTLPQGSVDNYGTLVADAGTIVLNAKVVNQNGVIQANSVKNDNGVIELVAGDQLNLGADSQILAQGDATSANSSGGTVTLQSAGSFSDTTGSAISVAGGATGGDGGSVDISAPQMPGIHSAIVGSAQPGFTGGSLTLDPDYIVLNTSGSSNGNDPAGDSVGTLYLNIYSAFSGMSQINLRATYDIFVADYTQWNLSSSTGLSSGTLTLQAGSNIVLGNAAEIYDTGSWNINLFAGVSVFSNDPVTTPPTVAPGGGSIYLGANDLDANDPAQSFLMPSFSGPNSANGFIQTANGNLSLIAGQDINVGTGRITTTGAGNLLAHALAGSIDTGGYAQGYKFSGGSTIGSAYSVDSYYQVGGISSTGDGSVRLIAGGDVTSLWPSEGGYYYDGNQVLSSPNSSWMTAGSGAYGSGDFTVIAGGNVTGYYLVADGKGSIYAGVQMDAQGNPIPQASGGYALGSTGDAGLVFGSAAPDSSISQGIPLSLGLITGSWNVTAANSIDLQEVNNPNGDFNNKSGTVNHQFNYGSADSVTLTAGNQVALGGTSETLPRDDTYQIPVIFPGTLDITAGAGGVVLTGDSTYDSLILFPSPSGSLNITTTDGGALTGSGGAVFNLVVSDSGAQNFNDAALASESLTSMSELFGALDHALTPIHKDSETALTLNISGDMDNIFLAAPEAAQVTVDGNMNNCAFQGMNLASKDVTSIDVTGNIENPDGGNGYVIGGGGQFDITADNIDLGSSAGIQSKGIGLYNLDDVYPLASLFSTGANIAVDTTGNLSMFLSSIASLNGGNISVNAGGEIAVGSESAVTALGARGIYTSDQGDVTVIADGDIDLNGSRIATYNGGNVTVESLDGNINAGTGGAGFVSMTAYQEVSSRSGTAAGQPPTAIGLFLAQLEDLSLSSPAEWQVLLEYPSISSSFFNFLKYYGSGSSNDGSGTGSDTGSGTANVIVASPTIPGSGIMATTFPDAIEWQEGNKFVQLASEPTVGNILVETPRGSVLASAGGIIQSPLDTAAGNAKAVTEVLAGYLLEDAGVPVTAANISSGTAVQISTGENINASGSGIIGENVVGKATGTFQGVVFGHGNVSLTSPQFGGLTVLGETITAQGNLGAGDTLIGAESVTTSGGTGGATILSANANGGGSSFAQGTTANAASSAASASDAAAATTAAKTDTTSTEDDLLKKKKPISLARKLSRVTVLLPGQH